MSTQEFEQVDINSFLDHSAEDENTNADNNGAGIALNTKCWIEKNTSFFTIDRQCFNRAGTDAETTVNTMIKGFRVMAVDAVKITSL